MIHYRCLSIRLFKYQARGYNKFIKYIKSQAVATAIFLTSRNEFSSSWTSIKPITKREPNGSLHKTSFHHRLQLTKSQLIKISLNQSVFFNDQPAFSSRFTYYLRWYGWGHVGAQLVLDGLHRYRALFDHVQVRVQHATWHVQHDWHQYRVRAQLNQQR